MSHLVLSSCFCTRSYLNAAVDLDYLVAVCKLCRVAGVDHFSVVSSQGASTNSPLLYPKTKGRGEKVRRWRCVKLLGAPQLFHP